MSPKNPISMIKSMPSGSGAGGQQEVSAVAEHYYDSDDADQFYSNIWGGEDIHIGLYDGTDNIAEAGRRTVARMAEVAGPIEASHRVLDLGAGYGGAARYLARIHGCSVDCLNISEVQNLTNRRLSAEQGLADRINVNYGSFEDIPEEDETYDFIWSQDAILHSGDRTRVFSEAFRVLKPRGRLVFTDPMQADDCPAGVLQPVYDRIHLRNLGSFGFYRQAASDVGFDVLNIDDLTPQLRNHYHQVSVALQERCDEIVQLSSQDYVDRMLLGLDAWISAADEGYLAWGILQFEKP
jgi:cyclopropane fatty-acyl-phospholipid synthase-like methyltransferase